MWYKLASVGYKTLYGSREQISIVLRERHHLADPLLSHIFDLLTVYEFFSVDEFSMEVIE